MPPLTRTDRLNPAAAMLPSGMARIKMTLSRPAACPGRRDIIDMSGRVQSKGAQKKQPSSRLRQNLARELLTLPGREKTPPPFFAFRDMRPSPMVRVVCCRCSILTSTRICGQMQAMGSCSWSSLRTVGKWHPNMRCGGSGSTIKAGFHSGHGVPGY